MDCIRFESTDGKFGMRGSSSSSSSTVEMQHRQQHEIRSYVRYGHYVYGSDVTVTGVEKRKNNILSSLFFCFVRRIFPIAAVTIASLFTQMTMKFTNAPLGVPYGPSTPSATCLNNKSNNCFNGVARIWCYTGEGERGGGTKLGIK